MLAQSDACERNKGPILEVLRAAFAGGTRVLEVGGGTGQHAVHFARNLPHLEWQSTELAENLDNLAGRIRMEGSANLKLPQVLDVRRRPWGLPAVDCVFTANTLHIMSFESVQDFFRGLGDVLQPGGVVCVYGPFNYGGRYTSESNAAFDRYLQVRDPLSGIRDFEAVDALARSVNLELQADHAMPANNRTLVWRRAL